MAGEHGGGREPTTRHYWYSRQQHDLIRNAFPFRCTPGGGIERHERYVAILPDGRVATDTSFSGNPPGLWPDYVYLGEHEFSACRYQPAHEVPLQDEGREPTP